MKNKWLLKLLIAVIAATTCALALVGCFGGKAKEDLLYELSADGESYLLVGISGSLYENACNNDTKITIPATYNGKPVISIGRNVFSGCLKLKSVDIPDTVTTIGDEAFAGCTELTDIIIPDGVTVIGNRAFYTCTAFTSIAIPDSVTRIGEEAFWGCSGLASITIPNGVTSIGEDAFYMCALTKVTIPTIAIPYTVTYWSKDSLKEVIITSGESISDRAFDGFERLTSITIPEGLMSIGEFAFADCFNIKSINYTGEIASWCGISGLEYLMNTMGTLYINGEELTGELAIPDSVTSIGNGAFYGCSGLTSVTIPNSVTSIGSFAFLECNGLTSITIPNSVTSIGDGAFYGCSGLASVTIPNSVTSICIYAFLGCNALTKLIIPKM